MYEVSSYTMTEDLKAQEVTPLEWKFQISNGNTGEMIVSDALLDTEELASERAMSEFLKNSYKQNEIKFTTYRTDITKNMTINVYGIPYLVKSITTLIDNVKIQSTIKAVRYE